jgi:hypothetical protein
VIISHFDRYPLISQKQADYELFKIVLSYLQGFHLTREGLLKIISIKASMNKGLLEGLKGAFPDIIPVARPLVLNQLTLDPH